MKSNLDKVSDLSNTRRLIMLQTIVEILDGEEWDSDTLQDIGDLFASYGIKFESPE